jgi:hypothetical protein
VSVCGCSHFGLEGRFDFPTAIYGAWIGKAPLEGSRFRPYRLKRHKFNRNRIRRAETVINKRLPGTVPDSATTAGVSKRASPRVNSHLGLFPGAACYKYLRAAGI